MQLTHILIVEDEGAIRDALAVYLPGHGFTALLAATGEAALPLAPQADLVVLDIGLPGMDGLEVLRRLRAALPQLPVLLLTAHSDDLDKIVALELGADDYLTKPFNPRELVARMKAVLRRSARPAGDGGGTGTGTGETEPPAASALPTGASLPATSPVLTVGQVRLDPEAHTVTVRGQAADLTPREFQLLRTLLARPGRVFTRDELLTVLWGENHVGDPKTVDVYVRRLRDKVEGDPQNPTLIVTVWGIGYKLTGNADG